MQGTDRWTDRWTAPKSTQSLTFSISTGLRSTNAMNINFFLLPTKFLQPVNLAIFTTWSPFNLLAVPVLHLLLLFLAHQPSSSFISSALVSPVSIHLLIHISTHPCHHLHSQHPLLLHSCTPGSKPTSSTNPSYLNFTSLLIGLPSW